MVSNIVGNMLESGTNNNQFQMEIPVGGNDDAFENKKIVYFLNC